jgi:hypothetical protein
VKPHNGSTACTGRPSWSVTQGSAAERRPGQEAPGHLWHKTVPLHQHGYRPRLPHKNCNLQFGTLLSENERPRWHLKGLRTTEHDVMSKEDVSVKGLLLNTTKKCPSVPNRTHTIERHLKHACWLWCLLDQCIVPQIQAAKLANAQRQQHPR